MDFEKVLFQAVLAFLVLFIISKLLGKKQIAQLEFTDYVVGISLGSIAANMVMEQSIPMVHYVIGMAVFGMLDFVISVASRKGYFFKKIFIGQPTIIIEKGKINYKNLKKSKLDITELVSQCRLAGYFNLNEIYYCIFETNGQFSFLSKAESEKVTTKDLNIKKQQEQYSPMLVIDGRIIKDNLKKIDKTKQWLFERLKANSKKDLKKYLLVTYNKIENDFVVIEKD